MKIKSIDALKKRLDRVTEGVEVNDEGSASITARYDVYEKLVQIKDESGALIQLTASEAKRLQSVLKELL